MKRILLGILVVLLPLGAACTESSRTGGKTKVTIALDWTPNTNYTGVYVAKQQGWFAEEGLEVEILPFAEGATPDVQVAAGKADFGFSFEEAVTQARAAGQPVVSVAAVLQQNTSAFVTLKDSGIDRPAKLEGKRYAGFGAAFEEPVIEQVIRADGGASGKVQNITTNVFGFEALVARQADFVWIFMGWEGVQAQLQKVALNVFPPTSFGVPNYYTPVIITNEKLLKDRPEMARKFMKAVARGYEHAVSDPDDAADLLIKAAPKGSFPNEQLVRESARYLAPRYKEGKSRWGEQDLQVWTDYPRFMVRTGKLKDASGNTITGELNYAAMFTNDFLPK